MTPPPVPPRLWLLVGDAPEGPLDIAAVYGLLSTGGASWDTLACPVGGAEWRPLRDQPSLAPPPTAAAPLAPTPVAHPKADARLGDIPKRPWNPTTLAWLTVAFSPLWGGVMAALNSRRVGAGNAVAGLGVGLGSTAANLAVNQIWELPYWLELAWYLGTALALWAYCFRVQSAAYARLTLADYASRRGGGWVGPALIGSPLALLVFLAFVIVPLVPPEPRAVCQSLLHAKTAAEAEALVTPHFRPGVVSALAGAGPEDPAETIRLTDEYAPPEDPGLYFVGFVSRSRLGPGKPTEEVGGAFRLVDVAGEWRIDDMLLTVAPDGRALETPVSLAANPGQPAAPAAAGPSAQLPPGVVAAGTRAATAVAADRKNWAWLSGNRLKAILAGAGLAVVGAFQAVVRGASGTPKSDESKGATNGN